MKEFLNANYELITVSSEHPVCSDWIEVPGGADIAVKSELRKRVFFYKDCGEYQFDKKWIKCGVEDEDGITYNNLKSFLEWGNGNKIIWQRSETEYLMQGKNGERLMESVGQLKDNVNQPNHYKSGGIECLDAMQAMLSRDEFIGFLRGNVFKYNWRYKLKNGIEDLKKAQFYQNKLIELESDDAI